MSDPAHVLLVDSATPFRESIARTVGALPGVQIHAATSVSEAVRRCAALCPDVVVSGVHLSDGSAADLLAGLASTGASPPVLLMCTGGCSNVATLRVQEIRRTVAKLLATRPVARNDLPFTLDEYLQMASFGRHSVEILVGHADGSSGVVQVWRGDVCSARDEEGVGAPAFRRIAARVLSEPAKVHCRVLAARPDTRDLDVGSWQSLLLDSARFQDERARGPSPNSEGTSNPAPSAIHDDITVEIDADSPGHARHDTSASHPWPHGRSSPQGQTTPETSRPDSFSERYERGVEALIARRYTEALEHFERANRLRPDHRIVRSNLLRLREILGVPPEPTEPQACDG